MNREIPIIADTYVDREFGTGVVKITPAHDPNDFEVGKRHNLPEIDVMTNDGHMNEAAGKYAGLERFAARARIVADLQELGLLESVKEHMHAVGICDRCKSIVEPRISTQWFMKMKPLAEPAKQVVRDGLIEVVPDNQRTILLNWLENIRDWCISRQLWWGHRIPIWHCADCKEMVPALDSRVEIVEGHARAGKRPHEMPEVRRRKAHAGYRRSRHVVQLRPMAVFHARLARRYRRPAHVLSHEPANQRLRHPFFLGRRMIMMGLHLDRASCKDASRSRFPFRRLYLHSLVRTAEGAKMSKTKGTGVDPLQLTQQYGTDALRYMLASMAAPGTDIALSEDRILGARAFANKIWNAARFLFVNLEKVEARASRSKNSPRRKFARKRRIRFPAKARSRTAGFFRGSSSVAAQVNDALENFRFHEACQTIYQFFWGDFCDWYIEWVKPQLATPIAKSPSPPGAIFSPRWMPRCACCIP